MEFVIRSAEEILEEIRSYSASPESAVEGTFSNDVFAANALEFMKVEAELSAAYEAMFAQTSWGDYLTMIAESHGVIRREATHAVGNVVVEGQGTIPAGAVFATESGVRFTADAETVINVVGEVAITAVEAGSSGNVAALTINRIPLSIPGIQTVLNQEATADGYDEETDAELRYRLLMKVREPATSGNPAEYVNWALEIAGVGAAICLRTPRGPGTVKVILVDSNFEEASAELIARVKAHIDELRPVGILNGEVEVVSAVPVVINVSADVTTADEDAFRTAVNAYFAELLKKNFLEHAATTTVSAARIGSLIIQSGGDDYQYATLRLNDEMADIVLNAEEFPTLGLINFY